MRWGKEGGGEKMLLWRKGRICGRVVEGRLCLYSLVERQKGRMCCIVAEGESVWLNDGRSDGKVVEL